MKRVCDREGKKCQYCGHMAQTTFPDYAAILVQYYGGEYGVETKFLHTRIFLCGDGDSCSIQWRQKITNLEQEAAVRNVFHDETTREILLCADTSQELVWDVAFLIAIKVKLIRSTPE